MRKFKANLLIGALAFATFFGAAVSAEAKAKKVTVDAPYAKTAEVAKGKKITLSPNQKVSYKVANTKIATVSKKGVVKGKKAGKTKVTLTSKKKGKKKTTVKIVVKKQKAKKVKLNSKNFSLAVKGKKTLKATVTPKKASSKVIWKTSNKKVAAVSSKGVVKGKKAGTAKITATAADGSKKKASVKVTVGTGVSGLSVRHYRILTLTLSGKKALKASDVKVQNKAEASFSYNTTETVEKLTTTDNKTYSIVLDSESGISSNSYVKVTVSSLSVNKTKEIYVSKVADYGNAGNTETEFEAAEVGDSCNETYNISNTNAQGEIKITGVSGTMPGGIAYKISKRGDSVRFVGLYNKVENGTAVVINGTDQAGKTFTQKVVFYVGNDTTIVGTVVPRTQLAYTPDNKSTVQYDPYGTSSPLSHIGEVVVAGAGISDTYYDYSTSDIKNVPESIGKWVSYEDEDGGYWSHDSSVAIPAGSYPLTLEVTGYNNGKEVKTNLAFNLNLVAGVTVTGTVKDAAGQPARYVKVSGATKMDEYGRIETLDATTDSNGKYTAKVLPGDYYTEAWAGDRYCDLTIGNNFTAATVTKDFALPMYRVDFTSNAPGAVAYDCDYYYDEYDDDDYTDLPVVMDVYGHTTSVRVVSSYIDANHGKMYAYLLPGTYTMVPAASDGSTGTVSAYNLVRSRTEKDDNNLSYQYYYLSDDDLIGQFNLSLSGSFNVAGNTSVTLTATKKQ